MMEIQDAIDYLENKKNNLEYDNQEKYIYQIECLEDLKKLRITPMFLVS